MKGINNEELRKLFGASTGATVDEQTFGAFMTAIGITADGARKKSTVQAITTLLFRVSFVASVWWFIFDSEKWYGILLFLLPVVVDSILHITIPKK